jgi:hypothetical protein
MANNALDILASVVTSMHETDVAKHEKFMLVRVSCHRCGNIRKRKILCPRESCPHIYCGRLVTSLNL